MTYVSQELNRKDPKVVPAHIWVATLISNLIPHPIPSYPFVSSTARGRGARRLHPCLSHPPHSLLPPPLPPPCWTSLLSPPPPCRSHLLPPPSLLLRLLYHSRCHRATFLTPLPWTKGPASWLYPSLASSKLRSPPLPLWICCQATFLLLTS